MQIKQNEILFNSMVGMLITHQDSDSATADLNSVKNGQCVLFTPSTQNIPVSDYGICLSFGRDIEWWRFQIAVMTDSDTMYYRKNINNLGWSAWKSITFS